jgi:tetratricopeptide (TPR) repeat protein
MRIPIAWQGLVVAIFIAGCNSTDVAQVVSQGDALANQGKLVEAVIEYRRAVQADERNGSARHKLGVAYARLGDLQRAREQLVRAADLLPGDAVVQLDAARALLQEGQFEDARTRAERVLKADPANVGAHLMRATALAGLKDSAGAIDGLKEAIKLAPTRSGSFLDLASLELAQGRRAEAEAAFKQAVVVSPKSIPARMALANFYWATSRRSEAEETLVAAVEIDPKHAAASQALAGLYIATDRGALAEGLLKRVADSSNDLSAKLALADYYVAEKRPAQGKAILEEVAKEPAGFAAARSRLAAIEYSTGNRQKGHAMLDEILKEDPRNAPVLLVRAGWLQSEGKLDAALTAARAAADADQKLVGAHTLAGSIYMAQNNPEMAIKSFTAALQLQPAAPDVLVALVNLNLRLGRLETALDFARQSVAAAPALAGPRHALARVFFAEGKLADAQRELAPVLQAAPNSVDALGLLGMIQQRNGDLAAARQTFARVLELDPKSGEALAGLVNLDLAARRSDTATERVEAAVKAAPNSAQTALLAGRTYAAAGDTAKAEAALKRALGLDPSLMEAYGALGQLYVKQKKLPEALKAYDDRTKERPNDVAAHTMVATLLFVQGKASDSRTRFERILDIDPRAAVALNNLAYMDAEAGVNLDVALNRAQAAKSLLPDDPDVNDTLGWVYVKRGLPALSFAPFEQALQKNPKNPLYHYHLGVAHANAEDRDRARLSLQRALQLSSSFDGANEAKQLLNRLGR